MKHHFKAVIYKTGINWAVDVPADITRNMVPQKGYIRIMGQINDFDFAQTLVPVKNGPYRLFVNGLMMKGGNTMLGQVAGFVIEEDKHKITLDYPTPPLLTARLKEEHLQEDFDSLSTSRKKDILRYLNMIKTTETLSRHIEKLVIQLHAKQKDVRVP